MPGQTELFPAGARSFRSAVVELAGLISIALASAVAVWPRGNFPLNDDWDFATATWLFSRTGHFHFTAFTAVSLRTQVLWGSLWTRLFGESFEVLRLSTLVLALASLVVLNCLLAHLRVRRSLRIVVTLALWFHPIFFWASFTYMTEVPFVFASLLALAACVIALERDSVLWMTAGCGAILLATFVRQTGAVDLAVIGGMLFLFRARLSPRWKVLLIPPVVSGCGLLAIFIIAPEWLSGSPKEFALHYSMWHEGTFRTPEMLDVVGHYSAFQLLNVTLFFLPLTLLLLVNARRPRGRSETATLLAICVLMAVRIGHLFSVGMAFPYFTTIYREDVIAGNIFNNLSLGVPTLTDVWTRGQQYPVHVSFAIQIALTVVVSMLGCALLWVLITKALDAIRDPRLHSATIIALGFIAAGTAALWVAKIYVDRYSLDSAWALLIPAALFATWKPPYSRLAIAALIVLALFDISAVHDYFTWNRARWSAIAMLQSRGVNIRDIDAGSEPANYLQMRFLSHRDRRRLEASPEKRYLIAFHRVPGFRLVKAYPFDAACGLVRAEVVVLERERS